MGFGSLVRSGVAMANRITGGADGLQVDVTHYRKLSVAGDGTVTYKSPVTVSALVEDSSRRFVSGDAVEAVARSKVTVLGDITVQREDEFTLPDGFRGPVLHVERLLDKATGRGYLTEVYLGWTGRSL